MLADYLLVRDLAIACLATQARRVGLAGSSVRSVRQVLEPVAYGGIRSAIPPYELKLEQGHVLAILALMLEAY